jgi:hypothetical protein
MRASDRPHETLLALALALAGCTCHGKGQPSPGAAAEHVEPVDSPAKAEVPEPEPETEAKAPEPIPAPAGRFDADRTGFVKAKLGEQQVEFTVLPRTQNRFSIGTKPPLVVVDGYATEGASEHLRVHIQGVPISQWKGRPLTPGDDRSWLVAVTYQDAQGKTWVGKAGAAPGMRVAIVDVDPKQQLVSGTFSGQLHEAGGEAVLEVVDGAFKTALAG